MHSFSSSFRDSGSTRTRPLHDFDDFPAGEEEGKLVMVVDDSHMICRIVEFSLEHYGISTVPFYSGVDALNALNDGAVPVPDLVLLDISMPDMSGYDVASMLNGNKAFKSVPIVMLSGHDGIFDRLKARRVGADDFIAKPFDKPQLVRKIFPLLALTIPEDIAGHQD